MAGDVYNGTPAILPGWARPSLSLGTQMGSDTTDDTALNDEQDANDAVSADMSGVASAASGR